MKLTASLLAAICVGAPLKAEAQIYADFTVSHGGTTLGTFRAELAYDKPPRTCANFIGLASGEKPWIDVTTGAVKTNEPYYNGLTFHRLIHNFVIQGGSPNGQGTDGPGYVIQDEFDASLRHSGRYMLSMAKTSLPNTGGSQFFITLENTSNLDDKHSVFGEVISGKNIIDGFTNATNFPTGPNDRPSSPIVMESVVISGPDLANFDLNDPALMLPQIRPLSVTPSRDSTANSFTVTFDRKTQHEYFYAYSFDLSAWTPFRYIRSEDSEDQWPFIINGVTFDRFFSRTVAIDYSLLPNPTSPLMPNGASLVISDRLGNSLTLVANGAGGGTWSDSSGANGSILSLSTFDGIGTSGTGLSETSVAHLFPLAQVIFELDAPTGISGHDDFNLVLSFHSPTSGWTDGTASSGSSKILHSFTYTAP